MQRTCEQLNRAPSKNLSGWLNGFIGVVIFSGSLPATRIAVLEFDPVFLTVARATIAGILALGLLALLKSKRPERNQLYPLLIVPSGSMPRKTIECADVTCCKASAVSKGNPTTTPMATISNG